MHLPEATPTFGAPSFKVAASFVVEGLATAHLPVSTAAFLPQPVRSRMRLYRINGMSRRIVLAMRKHLLTHGAYARIFRGIVDYCQTEFTMQIAALEAPPLGTILSPDRAMAAADDPATPAQPYFVTSPIRTPAEAIEIARKDADRATCEAGRFEAEDTSKVGMRPIRH
jgi:hypothetical protein